MMKGKKITGARKIDKAVCLMMALALLLLAGLAAGIASSTPSSTLATDANTMASPSDFSGPAATAEHVPVQHLSSATLVLTKPSAKSLIPYTKRGFDASMTATIAWWMEPGFYANTSEYRRYLRSSPLVQKTQYSEAKQIFFNYDTSQLDPAIARSPIKENLILYRGIDPVLAQKIIDNAVYIELAYPSTSYDITASLKGYATPVPGEYRSILVMPGKIGKTALYINENEREFLFPRNTKWAVIKAVKVDKLTVKANFLLIDNHKLTATYEFVQLIYVKQLT